MYSVCLTFIYKDSLNGLFFSWLGFAFSHLKSIISGVFWLLFVIFFCSHQHQPPYLNPISISSLSLSLSLSLHSSSTPSFFFWFYLLILSFDSIYRTSVFVVCLFVTSNLMIIYCIMAIFGYSILYYNIHLLVNKCFGNGCE